MGLVSDFSYLIAVHISDLAFDADLASPSEDPPNCVGIVASEIHSHRVSVTDRQGDSSLTLPDATTRDGKDISESDLLNENLSVTRHELIIHFVSSVVGCFIHYADHSILSQAVWQALFLIIF
jgi:hypothetical protein